MSPDLEAGAANCVTACAGARPGRRLFVVNETGAVDESVSTAIEASGRTAGAEVNIVWADPIPKETPDAIPQSVLEAYRNGDIVVSHFPSLSREALYPHFPGERRVRVPNRARSEKLLQSDWARFPYSVQRAIALRLEERMAPGRRWRITSPAGTEIEGVFGRAGGEVGAAYFVEVGNDGRARRNFPGGVHNPRASIDIQGVIAIEYMDHVPQASSEPPLLAKVRDCKIVGLSGGDGEGRLHQAVSASDGWIDSWHAGVNPRTVVPVGRPKNGRRWFGYSHCSPRILHFHLGRGHATTNLACFAQTLTVDGETLYNEGRLSILDDKVVSRAVDDAGIPDSMLANSEFDFW